MRFSAFFLLIPSLVCPLHGDTGWGEIQGKTEYVTAKKQIADYLSDLAIPRIRKLLEIPDLNEEARASLLTLLGEAQVRSTLPGEALETLDDPVLREFSPAHLWRGLALTQLGRYRDAIGELAKIDRRSMKPSADLQIGKLHLALGNPDDARPFLEPLLQSPDPDLAKEATLQMISLTLSEGKIDEGEKLLSSFEASNALEENLVRYLKGRIHLARGERLAAVGAFQTLLDDPGIRQTLSAPLFHESTLALADSLALEGNEDTAISSLLETLEKHPESPVLNLLFSRLRTWSDQTGNNSVSRKLETWTPSLPAPPAFPLVPRSWDRDQKEIPPVGGSILDLCPTSTSAAPPLDLRSLLSLEFLATDNLRSTNPDQQARGNLQLTLLELLAPRGFAGVNRALVERGMSDLREENYEEALEVFALVEENQGTPLIRSYAKSLAAQAAFALNNSTEASQHLLEAEKIARDMRQDELASLYALNAGISLLTTSRAQELDEITSNLSRPESRSALILERGLFLSSRLDPAARDLLATFLADFPNSPRAPEASLALSESAVFCPPFDPELALSYITPLRFDLESQPILEARRILVLLALGTNTRQALDFLTRSPQNPLADRVLFQLGQAYRNPANEEDKELGKANLQFELLLDQYPESPYADPARFYSALTSVALKTESADKSARQRFRELIDSKGVLANEAAINLCSFLIDRNLQAEALQEIDLFLGVPDLPDSDQSRLLILGADAANQTSRHEIALDYYERLLKVEDLPIADRNRAGYIQGQALEKLGRTEEALEAYYAVVNRNFDPAQATSLEWKWFDKCGIEGALALLEKEERWKAAIRLAEKIEESGSPRAKDAHDFAHRLALEHFIYRGRSAAGNEPEKAGNE